MRHKDLPGRACAETGAETAAAGAEPLPNLDALADVLADRLAPTPALAPGKLLSRHLHALNISQRELARRSGLSESAISSIIKGSTRITPAHAILLEHGTEIEATTWLEIESAYSGRLKEERD